MAANGGEREAPRRPAPGGDLYARWQTLQLLGPVFALLDRGAPRAGFDHTRYDLAQLALRAIDFVVVHQASLEGSVSPERIADHLAQAARRMHPDDQARPWAAVASLTLNTLLNDGRPHEATWRELAAEGDEWAEARSYRFRLLRLVDSDEGAAVVATDEAIVLYLQALNTDLADRAMALKLLVEVQMNAGEFDKALASARQATRTARGLSASLRDKLDDTRRDVRSVDWAGEMPAWLTDVMGQLEEQLDRDRRLTELALRYGEDPQAADTCRAIVEEVRRSEDVWVRLERHLQGAIPTFLDAQGAQQFRPRGLAALVDMVTEVLRPALVSDDETLARGAQTMAAAAFAPVVPPQWGVDELAKLLLRPPASFERHDPVIDDPDDVSEPVGDTIPDDIAVAAARTFAVAAGRPVRLSELLSGAERHATEVADPERLADVVWGAALWTFVAEADPGDEPPRSADLAAVLGSLIAVDDGRTIDTGRYRGADLLVGTPAAFDRAEESGTSAGQLVADLSPPPAPSPTQTSPERIGAQ